MLLLSCLGAVGSIEQGVVSEINLILKGYLVNLNYGQFGLVVRVFRPNYDHL